MKDGFASGNGASEHLIFVVKFFSCLPDLLRNFLVRNAGTSEPHMPTLRVIF